MGYIRESGFDLYTRAGVNNVPCVHTVRPHTPNHSRLLDTLLEHEMDVDALSLAVDMFDEADWREMGICGADVQRLTPHAVADLRLTEQVQVSAAARAHSRVESVPAPEPQPELKPAAGTSPLAETRPESAGSPGGGGRAVQACSVA